MPVLKMELQPTAIQMANIVFLKRINFVVMIFAILLAKQNFLHRTVLLEKENNFLSVIVSHNVLVTCSGFSWTGIVTF